MTSFEPISTINVRNQLLINKNHKLNSFIYKSSFNFLSRILITDVSVMLAYFLVNLLKIRSKLSLKQNERDVPTGGAACCQSFNF